ncbi:hypothetical protein TCAL_02217 [Tigriopus californicus]|uniref:C2H2-type domain-containing protein n=1 Tax=Tigriopus californicus TaxID=6832 RepID=A0A553P6M9_TIGCA|nr:gastrula zinc finger protein XlCGF26.1-like [Tigriopus californicus]TRY73332.1 hypothetical protein TCAL_02217 [Tigriopus californicus]|eukprot:TCALIF_02217-PA protein Name:"Similar to ZNF557 Zinc finger protein 557 (Homo sapiens)" AED:0.43 eAED:0.43 QI:181/1/1/1/0/0/2/133/546
MSDEDGNKILDDLGLIQVKVGSWIWILREEPDFYVGQQDPFHTLCLLYDEKSQHYIFRVLGRSFQSGSCASKQELWSKCRTMFHEKAACLGFQAMKPHSFPLSCSFSPQCLVVTSTVGKKLDPKSVKCTQCSEFVASSGDIADLLHGMIDEIKVEDANQVETKREGLSDEKDDKEVIREVTEIFSPGNAALKPKIELEDDEPSLEGFWNEKKKRGRPKKQSVDEDFDNDDKPLVRKKNRQECLICHKLITENKLERHLKFIHYKSEFKCDVCPQSFDFAQDLVSHSQKIHPTTPNLHCPQCKEPFEILKLVKHAKSCIDQAKKDTPLNFQCDICGKSFNNSHVFKSHKWSHMPPSFACQLCSYKATTSGNLKIHQRVHETGHEVVCPICGKMLKHKASLSAHVKLTHDTGIPKLPCERCGQTFKCRTSLMKHILRAHEDSEEWTCKKCHKKTGGKHEFRAHMRIHDEPTIVCPTCGIKVKTQRNLKAHMRTHTGEAPYKCHLCERTFKTSSPYYYHMMHVHNVKGKTHLYSTPLMEEDSLEARPIS